ncbi:ABC transporter permease [bacterium]|jgi:oligopeptide transport system permease protein|nr:ABC transporter permease [bacterium]
MAAYVLRRLLVLIPLLWAVATITFFLMHAVPGGPFQGDKAMPPDLLARMNDKYGLNDNIGTQYINFLDNTIHGDLGISYATQQPVVKRIKDGFPATMQLGISAFIFAIVVGLVLGVLSAVNQNGFFDYVGVFIATIGAAIPSFVVALLLILLFSLKFHWFNVIGWQFGDYKSMTLPIVALGLLPAAYIARITRASMLEVLRQDYIRTAQAKGLKPLQIINRHALRNALVPVLTVAGPIFAGLITGSFIIEYTFAINGIGTAFVDAVELRDYGMIMGTVLLYAFAIAICNMLVDVSYGFVDPRIRY